MKDLIVLGIRGLPAQHGGFETFAEKLCPYLFEQGWQVSVYCQEDEGKGIWESDWQGIRRIHIPVSQKGAFGTVVFDLKAVIHSLRYKGVFLTLGYNTAVFNVLHRLFGKKTLINMDGIEWKRAKWGKVAKTWFWLNERFGCYFGTHLIADHPKIADHLATRISRKKITTIAYGADVIDAGDTSFLDEMGLTSAEFSVVIARPEPENSILEIVQAFSAKKRNHKLVVLGNFNPNEHAYQKAVMDAASCDVIFPGAIYDKSKLAALRYHCRFYLHGHRVGGTNPSLVEALGASSAVIAHDNYFNRWVAADAAHYFATTSELETIFDENLQSDHFLQLKQAASKQFESQFQWSQILAQYDHLLRKYL